RKPFVRVDALATTSTAVASSMLLAPNTAHVGAAQVRTFTTGVGITYATPTQFFGGVIDEVAHVPRLLTTQAIDQLYGEYQNKWRPGRIHFRGGAEPLEPFEFSMETRRTADLTIKALDWTGQLSAVTIPSSDAGPPLSTNKDYAGQRI